MALRHPKTDEEMKQLLVIAAEEIEKGKWDANPDKLWTMYKERPKSIIVIESDTGAINGMLTMTPTFMDENVIGNIFVKDEKRGNNNTIAVFKLIEQMPWVTFTGICLEKMIQFYTNMIFGIQQAPSEYNHKMFRVHANVKEAGTALEAFKNKRTDIRILPFQPSRLSELIFYDSGARGFDSSLHTKMIADCQTIYLAEIAATVQIVGYSAVFMKYGALCFDCLVADSEDIALALYRTAVCEFPHIDTVTVRCRVGQDFFPRNFQIKEAYNLFSLYVGKLSRKPLDVKVFAMPDCAYMT